MADHSSYNQESFQRNEEVPELPKYQEHDDEDSVLAEHIYQQLIESICIQLACGLHRRFKTGDIPWSEALLPRSRHELFPSLYSDSDEAMGVVEQTLERYATDRQKTTTATNPIFTATSLHNQNKDTIASGDSSSLGGGTGSDAASPIKAGIAGNPENMSSPTTATSATAMTAVSTPVHESQSMEASTPLPPPPPPPPPTMQTRSAIHQVDIWGRCPPKEPKQLVTCSVCGRQVATSRFAPHLDKCMGVGTSTRASAAAANQQQNSSNGNIASQNSNNMTTSNSAVAGNASGG